MFPNLEDKFYTTGDIARMLGVSVSTIDMYIKKDLIQPDIRVGNGRRKFSKITVERFLQSADLSYERLLELF